MKRIVVVVCLGLMTTVAAVGQPDSDSAYAGLAGLGPVPAKGMAELTRRVVYPELAVTAGIHGTVFVTAFVNEKGGVDSTAVVRGVHPLLDSAAVRAVRETAFTPARYKGARVKAIATIPVKFSLQR